MSQQNKFKAPKSIKRKLIRGVAYAAIAGAVWFAQQQGWLNNKDTQQAGQQQSAQQPENQQAQTRSESSKASIQTLRLEDPLERGENHEVTNDLREVKTRSHSRENDNSKIAQLFKQQKSDTWVTAIGKVGKVLPDDNKGSRHQKFLLDIGQDKWLLVAHNIDLAPYVPLEQGDEVIVHGEYEYNEKGGVIHWTHHDPRGYKDGGYIEHNNKRYE